MNTIATLYQLRRHLHLGESQTSDDARLMAALEAATAMIEQISGRRYTPRYATIAHSINRHEASELLLEDDLLELTMLTNGNGGVIANANILKLPNNGNTPIGVLRLKGGESFVYVNSPLNAVDVTGIWGGMTIGQKRGLAVVIT